MMGSSIDIPPKPLPIAQSKELAPGLSILPPLSRKGSGPGIIILVPDSTAKLLIEDGIPSPSLKWAEEGYTVVEIRESALTADPRNLFGRAIQELAQSDTCEPKGSVGLVGR
jgi:carboxymethylenebutenolidase